MPATLARRRFWRRCPSPVFASGAATTTTTTTALVSLLLLASRPSHCHCQEDAPPTWHERSLAPEDTCEYFEGSSLANSPFHFLIFAKNHSITHEAPTLDSSTGVCTFPNVDCSAVGQPCCVVNENFKKTSVLGQEPSKLNLYLGLLVLVLPQEIVNLVKCICKQGTPEAKEKRKTCGVACCVKTLFFFAVLAEIYAMIVISMMTQLMLPVPLRNTLLATQVFMTPIREVFQFIEDVMTVKINAVLGSKDFAKVRQVLITGVVGGLASGIAAALVVTLITALPSVEGWLLVPYDFHASPGCTLVPERDNITKLARPYVLLTAWSWPFLFANMALRGFWIGIGDWFTFGGVMFIQQSIYIAGMYGVFFKYPSLTVLGYIGMASSFIAFLIMCLLLFVRRGVREQFGIIKRSEACDIDTSPGAEVVGSESADEIGSAADEQPRVGSEAETRQEQEQTHEHHQPALGPGTSFATLGQAPVARSKSYLATATWRETVTEGLLAMIADLAVQLPMTISVYVTGARLGIGAMYQISSLQAALPVYGLAWILGLTYAFRIVGSQFVGARNLEGFKGLYKYILMYTFLLWIVSLLTTAPFPNQISFTMGVQACEYLSEPACIPIYQSIFGGGDYTGPTMQGTAFHYFVFSLCGLCFYQVFKAGIYACQDYRFMAGAGVLSFFFVFIPTLIIGLWQNSGGAMLLPMYAPCLALAIAFAIRIERNIKRMAKGTFALWSEETDAESETGSETQSADETSTSA